MKKIFYLLMILFCSSMYAATQPMWSDYDKECVTWAINHDNTWEIDEVTSHVYIKAESILLCHGKINLIANGVPVSVDSIHSDSLGYYFCVDGWFWWTCCKCQYKNGPAFNTCQNCRRQKCQ